jgi:uncharacterized membrane protein HdeD (DUF308 family)
MNDATDNSLFRGIDEIRNSWGWFLALGILLILLGMSCMVFQAVATFATVAVLGWILLITGVLAFIQAFRTGTWSGFLLQLLAALFRGVTGFLLVRYPLLGAESLTMVLASLLIVGGMFRGIGSAMVKLPRWGWAAFSGAVSVLLGCLLLAQMPISGLWFIGFAIGVDLVFDGTAMVGFSTAIHNLPRRLALHAA